jgi:hypothetical protein
MSGRVIVIVVWEPDEFGIMHRLVSHGVDEDTLETVVLPPVSPSEVGVRFDSKLGEYVLG